MCVVVSLHDASLWPLGTGTFCHIFCNGSDCIIPLLTHSSEETHLSAYLGSLLLHLVSSKSRDAPRAGHHADILRAGSPEGANAYCYASLKIKCFQILLCPLHLDKVDLGYQTTGKGYVLWWLTKTRWWFWAEMPHVLMGEKSCSGFNVCYFVPYFCWLLFQRSKVTCSVCECMKDA